MSSVGAAVARTGTAVREAARDARRGWSLVATAAVVAAVVAALLPLLAPGLRFDGIASALYVALAAVGLAFAVGLAGIPSLGQGAFMGIGAFGAALLQTKAGWPGGAAIAAATGAAAVAGIVAGLGIVRLRPVLVAVSTWILTWLVALALAAFPNLSGGSQGLVVDGRLAELSAVTHYEVALALVALAMLAFVAVSRGAAGLGLAAVRQAPHAALTLGLPVARLRLGAFVASAAIGGLAGAFAVQLAGVTDPSEYGPLRSFELFVAVVIGGATAAAGGLAGVGALAVLSWLADPFGRLEAVSADRVQTLLAAFVLLLVLGLNEEGLLPAVRRLLLSRAHAREPAPPVGPPGRPFSAGAPLVAHGLTKRFGALAAADAVELDVFPGEIHALLGPNGSGKTTVLRLLNGTLAADGGSVELDGRSVDSLDVRGRVVAGIVSTLQTTSVFPELTALENVLVGVSVRRRFSGALRTLFSTPRARREEREARRAAAEALAVVGLNAVAETPAEQLSAFDQRRLMLAAAIATQPQALLLDEPSAGASASELEVLAGVLGELRGNGLALLLVEHSLRLVRAVADRVTVLEAGRVIATGTPDEVGRDPAVQAAYLGRQRLGPA